MKLFDLLRHCLSQLGINRIVHLKQVHVASGIEYYGLAVLSAVITSICVQPLCET